MGRISEPGVDRLIGVWAAVQVEEDGIVFFRESCFRQSGDKARKSNPTHYRFASLGASTLHAIAMLSENLLFATCNHYAAFTCL